MSTAGGAFRRSLTMAGSVFRPEFFRRKFRALKYKITFDAKGQEACILHPGIMYDYQVHPSLSNLGLIVEACLQFATYTVPEGDENGFLEFVAMNDNHMTVTGSTDMAIEDSLYDWELVKSPLDVRVSLYNIGQKSTYFLVKAFCHNSDVLLFSNVIQILRMNPASRELVPFPDWWRQKYADAAICQHALRIHSDSKPDDARVQPVHVTNHDTDYQGHTNWTSYMKFCLDAAFMLNLRGQLRHVSKEAVSNGLIKRFQARYVGESFTGDVLQLYTWGTADTPNLLKCEVHRDDKPACLAALEYFPSPQKDS